LLVVMRPASRTSMSDVMTVPLLMFTWAIRFTTSLTLVNVFTKTPETS